MPSKTLLITAPLGLGAVVLAWAAMTSRGEPESKPVRAPARPASVRKASPVEISASVESPAAAPYVAARPAAPTDSPENALILERIRILEEKLLTLEAKRDLLLAGNQDLDRQIAVKNAEQSARTTAEWRVRMWEQLLGLTETQKRQLIELCTQWARDDAGKPAGRDAWLQRETDLRSMLSVEQAAKLHDTAAQQSEQQWKYLGRTIGGMVGASKDDQIRYQQTLGDYRAPNAMLLPEGYGIDWPGMLREGASRLQPLLSSEQQAKLGRHVQR